MNSTDLIPLPARPNLGQYRKQAKDLLKAWQTGEAAVVERGRKTHPRWKDGMPEVPALADAQWVIALEHGYESWPKFTREIEALLRAGSAVSRFEQAADSVVNGDLALLRRLVEADPGLLRARSGRVHAATLLHYVGANGFENFRQRTPPNSVEIARFLLDAGAEVDAVSGGYGKDTTLGLVATSAHPRDAGVQLPLMELLIELGASVEGAPGGWSPILGALANGRKEAAVLLAERGANLDVESAAGVGRLDVVHVEFDTAPAEKVARGFLWACEYGRVEVIEYLLDRQPELACDDNTGMNGLHWAIVGGELEAVRLLVERGNPLEERNQYGGTALECALWAVTNTQAGAKFAAVVECLLAAGAVLEDGAAGWLLRQKGGIAAGRQAVAEVLRRYERAP